MQSQFSNRGLHSSPTVHEASSTSLNVPAKVEGWPTLHIQEEDLSWLHGLYSQRWGIHYAPTTDTDNEYASTTSELGKIFQFKGFKTAMEFVNGVADLAHDEKVLPNIHPLSRFYNNLTRPML